MTDKEYVAFVKRLEAAQAEDDARTPEEVAAWEKLQDETLPEAPPMLGEDDDSVIAVFLKKTPGGRAKRTQKN